MDFATSLIACFGVGAAVGGIGGGFVGGWLYRRDKRVFFIYQAVATISGAFLLRWLLHDGECICMYVYICVCMCMCV